jgi:hypothetical protein
MAAQAQADREQGIANVAASPLAAKTYLVAGSDGPPPCDRQARARTGRLGADPGAQPTPSGDPTPSKADITATQDIKKAAAALGVVLHDHLIIGRNRHTSLRDLGAI